MPAATARFEPAFAPTGRVWYDDGDADMLLSKERTMTLRRWAVANQDLK